MGKKQYLKNIGGMGLALWLLTGCASLGGSEAGNDGTQQISFFYENPQAKSVCVVGSFNAWAMGADPLVKMVNGKWEATLSVPRGIHQYMYVVDGKVWVPDPNAHRTLDDGFGRTNALLVVE